MPTYCTTAACARKKKRANYGVQGSRKKEWCGTCAKEHGGVLLGTPQMCEDCRNTRASYGLPNTPGRKYKWCGTCAKRYGGVLLSKQMCEDCHNTQASYGLPDSRKRQWCGCPTGSTSPTLGSRRRTVRPTPPSLSTLRHLTRCPRSQRWSGSWR